MFLFRFLKNITTNENKIMGNNIKHKKSFFSSPYRYIDKFSNYLQIIYLIH